MLVVLVTSNGAPAPIVSEAGAGITCGPVMTGRVAVAGGGAGVQAASESVARRSTARDMSPPFGLVSSATANIHNVILSAAGQPPTSARAVRQWIESGNHSRDRRSRKLLLALGNKHLGGVEAAAIHVLPGGKSVEFDEQHARLCIPDDERFESELRQKRAHGIDEFCRGRIEEAHCLELYAAGRIDHIGHHRYRGYPSHLLFPGVARPSWNHPYARVSPEPGRVRGDPFRVTKSCGGRCLRRRFGRYEKQSTDQHTG